MGFNYNVFERDNYAKLMLGVITKINTEPVLQKNDNNKIENNALYRTIDVKWIGGRSGVSTGINIPSDIHSEGYGINILPCVGDLVICGMEQDKTEQMIVCRAYNKGYLHGTMSGTEIALNKYGDVQQLDNTSIPTKPFRYITPGEISIISIGQFEIYLDEKGTCKLIARDKETEWENKNRTDKSQYQFLGNRIWELSIGKQIINEGTKEIEKTDTNKNKQIQLKNFNGLELYIDEEGNFSYSQADSYQIKMSNNGNWTITGNNYNISMTDGSLSVSVNNTEMFTLNANAIQIGKGSFEPAVLGTTLEQFLNNFITSFNTHTHICSAPGTPTSPPVTQAIPPQKILSEIVKVSK